jgi:hypothetical protein
MGDRIQTSTLAHDTEKVTTVERVTMRKRRTMKKILTSVYNDDGNDEAVLMQQEVTITTRSRVPLGDIMNQTRDSSVPKPHFMSRSTTIGCCLLSELFDSGTSLSTRYHKNSLKTLS